MNSLELKHSLSHPFFRNTRVESCKYVLGNNTFAVAIAYPHKKTGYRAPYSYINTIRSTETQSHSASTYKLPTKMHAGMSKKPLIPYSPNSPRSRLLTPEPSILPQTRSSIQFLDGSNPKQALKTTYQCFMKYPKYQELTLLASKASLHKSRLHC